MKRVRGRLPEAGVKWGAGEGGARCGYWTTQVFRPDECRMDRGIKVFAEDLQFLSRAPVMDSITRPLLPYCRLGKHAAFVRGISKLFTKLINYNRNFPLSIWYSQSEEFGGQVIILDNESLIWFPVLCRKCL